MFAIGMVLYFLVMWVHSGEGTMLDYVLEYIALGGVGLMVASVAILTWRILP